MYNLLRIYTWLVLGELCVTPIAQFSSQFKTIQVNLLKGIQ